MSWCIIETQDSDIYEFSDVVCHHKTRKVSASSELHELQTANLLQVAISEAQDTLMNTSPTQSVINV